MKLKDKCEDYTPSIFQGKLIYEMGLYNGKKCCKNCIHLQTKGDCAYQYHYCKCRKIIIR